MRAILARTNCQKLQYGNRGFKSRNNDRFDGH